MAKARLLRLHRSVFIDLAAAECRVPWARAVFEGPDDLVSFAGIFDIELGFGDGWWPAAVVWVPSLERADKGLCCSVYFGVETDLSPLEGLGELEVAYAVRARPPWAFWVCGGDRPPPKNEPAPDKGAG